MDNSVEEGEAEDLEEEEELNESQESDKQEEQQPDFDVRDLVPRPWLSSSTEETEKEVRDFTKTGTRPIIRLRLNRKRRDFGQIPAKFSMLDAPQSTECRFTKDAHFKEENYKRVLEIGLQAGGKIKRLPMPQGQGFQSVFFRTSNHNSQYSKDDYADRSKGLVEKLQDSSDTTRIDTLIYAVEKRMEESLQSNETIDVFHDDFTTLQEEESGGTGELQSLFREERTFHNLTHTKGKIVSDIQWDPVNPGFISASCIENLNFDMRVDRSGRHIPGSIIKWSFDQFSNTRVIYKSPVEVTKFLFMPSNPNVVAAGLISGQVALWDSTEVEGIGEEPEANPLIVSGINDSHRGLVVSVAWLPQYVRVDRRSPCTTFADPQKITQLASLSEDGYVMIWDTVFPPDKSPYLKSDIIWLPLLKFQLTKPDTRSEIGGAALLFHNMQKESRFYCASDSGELMVVDWVARTMEESKPEHVKSVLASESCFRTVVELKRSPFFDDILMTVHDFHFCIWKEKCDIPILQSYYSDTVLTCGDFSPTRAGVLFIGKADGTLAIWDFFDQTHKESMTYTAAGHRLTSLRFMPHKTLKQLLAVGDMLGNIHILEVPRNISKKDHPGEKSTIEKFWEEEERRVKYYQERFAIRAQEAQKKMLEKD